jgi:hypothetical protein
MDEGRIAIWSGSKVITNLWLVMAADRASDPLLGALRDVLAEVWADTSSAPRARPTSRRGALVA